MKNNYYEGCYGISKEPENTCPMIDSVIKSINVALSDSAKYKKKDDIEVLQNILDDVEWNLNSLESDLEDIRSHVEKIREWGKRMERTLY